MILEIAKSSEAEIINLIVVERELPLNVASSVLKYTKKGNFLQILYAYPFYILQELLKIFENNNDFATCIIIRDTVKNHNKATGSNLKLK